MQAGPDFFEQVVETVGVGVAVYGDDGRYVYVNQAYADLLGTTRDRLTGTPIWAVNPAFERGRFDEYWDSFAVGETRVAETTHALDETSVPVSVATTCRHIEDTTYHFGTIEDISERKERERKLSHLRQILTRVLRHNIRNGLGVIKGQAELLGAELDSRHAAAVDTIVETSDDILDLSETAHRIGRLIDRDPSMYEYDLVSVVDDAVADVREQYPETRVTVTTPERCRVVASDGLGTAVGALVENAAEHNDAADPWVRVSIDEGSGDLVELAVEDNGPGIPPQELTAITAAEEDPLKHGTGLSLWLVNWVVDISDGAFRVAETDDGTRVVLGMPAAASD